MSGRRGAVVSAGQSVARRLAGCAAGAVVACASMPPPDASGPPDAAHTAPATSVPHPSPDSRAVSDFESQLRERATLQGRQGRLAEAATAWEVLIVLRPDEEAYRDRLSQTRRLIAAAVSERQQRGAQAQRRGDLDAATTNYLAALALQPDHAGLADALRQIERERNGRNFLGKPSRLTLVRRPAEVRNSASTAGTPVDRNSVEHAAMLGTQGEYDDAIALLERHLTASRRDIAACRLLAEMYFQKAEKQPPGDRAAAIGLLQKSIRLDPTHARASVRLKALNGGRSIARTQATTPLNGSCDIAG